MKTVIAVWGLEKIGKTSMIRRVFDKLNIEGKVPEKIENDDICSVVTLCCGKKIGVESLGDPASAQPEWIDYLVQNGCEVIVCASRTRGATVNAVENLTNKGYRIVWMSPFSGNGFGHELLNDISADAVIELIERCVAIK